MYYYSTSTLQYSTLIVHALQLCTLWAFGGETRNAQFHNQHFLSSSISDRDTFVLPNELKYWNASTGIVCCCRFVTVTTEYNVQVQS